VAMNYQDDELMQIFSTSSNPSLKAGFKLPRDVEKTTIYDTAISHIKPYNIKFKTHRTLKICAQSGYKYQAVPAIRLHGKWLKEIGFELGMKINVKCEEGKLTIILLPNSSLM
jgi:toxic protein SymE